MTLKPEELEEITKRFEEAVKRRREAEKILEKLALEHEKLRVQRDMLYQILLIVGGDIDRISKRIVNKFAKLITLRSDLRTDLTTSTLVQVHKQTLLQHIEEHMREVERAFDEHEIEKAVSHLRNMLSLVKTLSK